MYWSRLRAPTGRFLRSDDRNLDLDDRRKDLLIEDVLPQGAAGNIAHQKSQRVFFLEWHVGICQRLCHLLDVPKPDADSRPPNSMVKPTSPRFTRWVTSLVLTSSVPRPCTPVDSWVARGSENARLTTRGHCRFRARKRRLGRCPVQDRSASAPSETTFEPCAPAQDSNARNSVRCSRRNTQHIHSDPRSHV